MERGGRGVDECRGGAGLVGGIEVTPMTSGAGVHWDGRAGRGGARPEQRTMQTTAG